MDTTWNLFRKVHPPEKYSANPLVAASETGHPDWGSILYDEDLKRFRYWTRVTHSDRSKWDMRIVHAYYESEDGIHWTAPKLGLVEFEGSKENNFLRGGKGMIYGTPSVLRTPQRHAWRGKYVMLYGFVTGQPEPGQIHNMQDRIAWSDDGIHWEDQPENPVFRGRNDCFNTLMYNPERDVFMQYRRASVNAHEIRRIAYTETRGLISWTQPVVVVSPDELDPPCCTE